MIAYCFKDCLHKQSLLLLYVWISCACRENNILDILHHTKMNTKKEQRKMTYTEKGNVYLTENTKEDMLIEVGGEDIELLVEVPEEEGQVALNLFVGCRHAVRGVRQSLSRDDVDAPVHLWAIAILVSIFLSLSLYLFLFLFSCLFFYLIDLVRYALAMRREASMDSVRLEEEYGRLANIAYTTNDSFLLIYHFCLIH